MRIGNVWYNLKNVKRIEKGKITVSKHSSRGNRYELYHSFISIIYMDNSVSYIDFKDFTNKHDLENDLEDIFDQLIEEIDK